MIRYGLARQKAIGLLTDAHVNRPPIPIEKLATIAKASIRLEPFAGQMSGMVHRRKDGSAVIGVNSLHPKARRRFTIAHELGHLLLHKNDDIHIDERFPIGFRSPVSGKAVDIKEIEANQFAAECLMPTHLLVRDLSKMELDLGDSEDIEKLAVRYQVSRQAMALRVEWLQARNPRLR